MSKLRLRKPAWAAGAITGTVVILTLVSGPAAGAATGSGPHTPTPLNGAKSAIVGPGAVPSGAAIASSSWFSCADLAVGNLCMWSGSDYVGSFWHWNGNIVSYNTWHYVGDGPNDGATSLYNHRSNVSYLSKNFPPGTQTVCVNPEWATPNLGNYSWPNGTSMNNSISGFDLVLNKTSC